MMRRRVVAPLDVGALLAWYRAHKREMPWRGHPDPYAVWVSEIMLQQTQVETVRPYFARFLKAFPTVEALARAEDEPLLKAWEGLGYYTRARNLRKAAQVVVAEYGGRLPRKVEALEALPGIGAYTAAAVASLCYAQPVPVVDGNVARVFARRNGISADFSKPVARRELAQWLLPYIEASGNPADFNQAMMELGALVCLPRHAQCEACPLREGCFAFREGKQGEYPVRSGRAPLPLRKGRVVVVRTRGGELLLRRHEGERLLAGFWELPELVRLPFKPEGKARKRLTYHQTFSHFRLELEVCEVPRQRKRALPAGMQWCAEPGLLPLTTATRKILARLGAGSEGA